MNKKIKFIAPVLCGTILGSSLFFTNVQASELATQLTGSQKVTSINGILANEKYECYYTLNSSQTSAASRYLRDNNSPTINGLRDVLIQQNVPITIANNISISLYLLGTELNTYPFFEAFNGLEILQPKGGQGTFNIVGVIDGHPSLNYDLFAVLTPDDIHKIRQYIDSLHGSANIPGLADYLVKNNVTSDRSAAYFISRAASELDYRHWADLDAKGKNILVIKADDPSVSQYSAYHIARLPK